LRLGVLVSWHGAELDGLLAAGADPHASVLLAERARRLTTPRSRKRVAQGLRRAWRSAQARPGFSAAVRPNANELLAARAVVAAIDHRLRSPDPVRAQGVARLQALLTNGGSALYLTDSEGRLASELRRAASALAPQSRESSRASVEAHRPPTRVR